MLLTVICHFPLTLHLSSYYLQNLLHALLSIYFLLSVLNTTTEYLNPMKVGDRGSLIYSRSWKQTKRGLGLHLALK